MPSSRAEDSASRAHPRVTGIGVATGFGFGKASFIDGLFSGRQVFAELMRPGREPSWGGPRFVGVELPEAPEVLPRRVVRTAGLSGRVAAAVVHEAWAEAGLDRLDPTRIGLVIGGSNLQNREMHIAMREAIARNGFVSPHLGYSFFDTDIAGLCSEVFGIRGRTWSAGGGAASSAVAVIQAAEVVASGRLDACIAVGALQDLSCLELQALSVMGAAAPPDAARGGCRPFDRGRQGFVFGESAAALVIERAGANAGGGGYGCIAGAAHVADGHRGPDPSLEGELRAIREALAAAGVPASEVDNVNAHGTGTSLGDDTEAAAFLAAGLEGAYINATKSIIGHGIASAGAVEVAATLLQMRAGCLHPTRNLDDPINPDLRWVRSAPVDCTVRSALSLSFGFGGINTAIVLCAPEGER